MAAPQASLAGGAPRGATISVEVPATLADVVAEQLFAMGASAVAEVPCGPDGRSFESTCVILVADVDAGDVAALHPAARLVSRTALAQVVDAGTVVHHGPREPQRCGERIVVRVLDGGSPGVDGGGRADPADGSLLELTVDARYAFGGATHPSTRMCLAALEPLAASAGSVLDVGSGTGVLGVAALLLGADRLRAIDHDPLAVASTGWAAGANGVGERTMADATPLAELAGSFDLVLANLLVGTHEELGTALVDRVAPGGSVVAGGFLADRRDRVLAALRGCELVAERRDGDWSAIVATKRPPS